MTRQNAYRLVDLLDGMSRAAEAESVSLRDVLNAIGDRAITPLILLVAIALISPLSGIPGVPTLAAIIIILLGAQAIAGRRRLWLPELLLRRRMAGHRLQTCVRWLRRPCAFVDRHSHPRLQFLSLGPLRYLTLLMVVIIPVGWPFLEVLPLVSSIGAGTVALLVFGLFTRDGLYVLLGYLCVAATLLGGYMILF